MHVFVVFGLEGLSLKDLGCAWLKSRARSSWWVDRMQKVNGLVHQTYSHWDE